jgi:predicted hydrocarbon binding protein
VYSSELTSLSWIDVLAVLEHLLIFDRVVGSGDGKASEAMIRYLANKHFNGIYRIMFNHAGPKEIVKKASSIWDRYYDCGRTVIEFVADNAANVRVMDCSDLPRHHEQLVVPYMEEVLRLSGVKNVSVKHLQCVAMGSEFCLYRYNWIE